MIAEMLLAGAVMLNTSYTGPDITSVESREVGMRECVKAHTSGYQKSMVDRCRPMFSWN